MKRIITPLIPNFLFVMWLLISVSQGISNEKEVFLYDIIVFGGFGMGVEGGFWRESFGFGVGWFWLGFYICLGYIILY